MNIKEGIGEVMTIREMKYDELAEMLGLQEKSLRNLVRWENKKKVKYNTVCGLLEPLQYKLVFRSGKKEYRAEKGRPYEVLKRMADDENATPCGIGDAIGKARGIITNIKKNRNCSYETMAECFALMGYTPVLVPLGGKGTEVYIDE